MRGDIDNTQLVIIDGAPSAISRVIYSRKEVPDQRVQFGTIQVGHRFVAVWRPFDPDDKGYDAAWRWIPWRNVYRVHVPHAPIPDRPRKLQYALDDLEIDGPRARLPVANLRLDSRLKEHLEKL